MRQLHCEFRWEKTKNGRRIIPSQPPEPTEVTWTWNGSEGRLTLGWSYEALADASYEMTAWFMGRIRASLYRDRPLPGGWEDYSPEEAGFNAVKQALYYGMLHPGLLAKDEDLATKLYNVYGFGYAIGISEKKMLWPEDLKA